MHAFLKSEQKSDAKKLAFANEIKKKRQQIDEFHVDFIKDGVLFDTKSRDPNRPSIPEFFKGRDIFITGGTGFMGKVLIEKLVRSCPDINRIFVLMRGKRGKNVQERLEELKNLPLFELLRTTQPKLLEKIIPVEGDVTELQLGLSPESLKSMENVSVIFHAAASVRFDDTLQYAIILNTRGTREVMRLGETLKKIKVILHVSTTYCNIKSKTVKEEIYPPLADWKKSIKIAETIDPYILDILGPKYTRYMPNTYTFSKNLSEQIINDYKERLPVICFRPSIVISTMKDPFPGWIDNFNGPVGLLVGCGMGITRTMYCNKDNIADFTPVDVSIKAMIVAAWKRAIDGDTKELPVYNSSTSTIRQISMEGIVMSAKDLSENMPLEKMIWAPGGSIAMFRITNFIKTILFHILPAVLIDYGLKLTGRAPFVLGLQRKVYNANCALEYFILNNWKFLNVNFLSLDNEIKEKDIRDFHYTDFVQFDMMLYLKNCILGGKRYLLGEKDENIPYAKANYEMMKKLDFTVKATIFLVIFYFTVIHYDCVGIFRKFVLEIFALTK
uniref:Fatty acyl-CoA reductase n=1 Tax=Culicoides sonorensis TaxID=179676 RepID=A0A336M1N3_CULSO